MSGDLANRLSELAELLAEGDITEAAYQRRLEKLRAQAFAISHSLNGYEPRVLLLMGC
jgi:hypothetical protein